MDMTRPQSPNPNMSPSGFMPLIVCSLLTLAAGCERSGSTPRKEARRGEGLAKGCNLLLITMDTTRADRLGCYGFRQAATPSLDSLAGAGVRFDRAYAHSPLTLPSHTSLMTGTYPPENGVRVNRGHALGPGLTTLAEIFQRHGYRTGAFIAAPVLDARFGLGRGFDVYDDEMSQRPHGRAYERPADLVRQSAMRWIRSDRAGPVMCWVHFFDPHAPYQAPPEFVARTKDPYDAEVAFMDHNVGEIIQTLRSDGLLATTLVVAVADHGESLGDHGYDEHALLLYEGILRVPLIFSLPGRLPEDVSLDRMTRMVDIMPTILDLMGWQTPPDVSGESFAAAFEGGEVASGDCYGETDYPFTAFGWAKLRSLVDQRWKYIRAPSRELYDLDTDPRELTNLAAMHPDVVERMEDALARTEAAMRPHESRVVRTDDANADALRSLGYVGGHGSPSLEPAHLRDPKDRVAFEADFRRAAVLISESRLPEAIALLEQLASTTPGSFVVEELLGIAYVNARRPEDAQTQFVRALSLRPDAAKTCGVLAQVLAQRGRFKQAVGCCRRALELDPNQEGVRGILAKVSADLKKQERMVEADRQELRRAPDAIEPRIRLTVMLVRRGEDQDALEVLRVGLARRPEHPVLASTTALLLATSCRKEVRDGAEAVRLAQLACDRTGGRHHRFVGTLAAALAEAGRFDEAAQTARRAANIAARDGDTGYAAVLNERAKLFEVGRAFLELP